MSAQPSIPGMTVIGRKHLRSVPTFDSCSAANAELFDYRVAAGEQGLASTRIVCNEYGLKKPHPGGI
jgi:hypothetical protein